MSRTVSARTRTRRTVRPYTVGLVVVTAAIIGILVYQLFEPATSSAHSFGEVLRGDHGGMTARMTVPSPRLTVPSPAA
jgi:zinc D-Ala-D-Ala carboxypeptidase